MIQAIYPYGHWSWWSGRNNSAKEYSRLNRLFAILWCGWIAIVIATAIKRFRVIRQPKPRSNFKAWRYKR